MLPFTFAGQSFHLLRDRALLWTEHRALIVADLHLEKASWFARTGQHLPPYDSVATLTRLTRIADMCDAAEIWALGDNFHDDAGPERLDKGALALIDRLASKRAIRWITGNHDDSATMPGEQMVEAVVDGIVLRHHASRAESRPEISGHFHPSIRITAPGRTIRRACAVMDEKKLIVPAFGSLTGTLDCNAPPIREIVATAALALVATNGGGRQFTLG